MPRLRDDRDEWSLLGGLGTGLSHVYRPRVSPECVINNDFGRLKVLIGGVLGLVMQLEVRQVGWPLLWTAWQFSPRKSHRNGIMR